MRMTIAARRARGRARAPRRRAARRPTREPEEPGQGRAEARRGRSRRYTVCKRQELRLPHDPGGGQQGAGRRHGQASRNGTYREARHGQRAQEALPADRRQPASTRARSCSTARASRRKAQNGFFVNGADEVTIDGFTARNYKANGFFVVNVDGYTLHATSSRARSASTASTPSTPRAARCALGGLLQQRRAASTSGRRRRRPSRSARSCANVKSLGQRARLLGHEHALRDDHEVASTTTAPGIVPNALDSEKFPPAGGQRHHRQRHLLEQLQLLRGRAVQAAQADGGGDARTRSAPASCCSAAGATASRTTASSATTSSASGAIEQHPARRDDRGAATSIGNQIRGNAFGARRHRPQRPRPRSTTATAPTTASGRTPACRRRCPPDGSTFAAVPVHAAPTRSARTPRASVARLGRSTSALTRRLDQAPARPSRASRRSRSTSQVSSPRRPRPRRRRARRGAGRGAPRPSRRRSSIADNYYVPAKLTVKPRHDGHLALARRGRRRPRRQAQERRPRASRSSTPSRRRRATRSSASSRSPGATRSSARSTRR